MNEAKAQARDELIANRDEVIEQLQGEWAIDKDIKSVNRKAIRLGVMLFVAGTLVTIILFFFVYLTAQGQEKANMQGGLIELVFMLLGLMWFFGGLVYAGVHINGWWHRKLNPIEVDGHKLVWNKKKGFVPERVSLLGLQQVVSPGGNDFVFAPMESVFVKLLAKLMGSSGGTIGACMLISHGEHNTPKISSAMFVEGNRLIQLLVEVAAINTKLNELDKPKA